jgi:hypothetical protein
VNTFLYRVFGQQLEKCIFFYVFWCHPQKNQLEEHLETKHTKPGLGRVDLSAGPEAGGLCHREAIFIFLLFYFCQ